MRATLHLMDWYQESDLPGLGAQDQRLAGGSHLLGNPMELWDVDDSDRGWLPHSPAS